MRPAARFLLLALQAWCLTGVALGAAKAAPAKSQVVVVKSVASCQVGDRSYAGLLADRVGRWLNEGGVRADVAEDGALAAALAGRRLAYLVTFQNPTAGQLRELGSFRAKGGKIVVVQSYSPQLASFMGLPPQRAGMYGRASIVKKPAKGGWWVANAFAADVEDGERAKLLLQVAGMALPGCWDEAAWKAKQTARRASELAYGRKQVGRAGEIHAVWDQTGQGLYPGDWPRTMRLLKARGVTDVFVNVAGAGFAHYPSSALPRSTTYRVAGDQLAASVAAGHAVGIRVHAWVLCFTAARADEVWLRSYAKRGWRLRDRKGVLTQYLDPSNRDLRAMLLMAVDEMVRGYAVDGLHLDFVRWYEGAQKPAGAAGAVSEFVTAARRKVRALRPKAWLSAAVLASYPSCLTSAGQNWMSWLDSGLIDYAVPMNYVPSQAKYWELVARQGRSRARAKHILSGIGVTANEGALTPREVVDRIVLARKAGLAGVALFDLDRTLAEKVLDVLAAGVFSRVK